MLILTTIKHYIKFVLTPFPSIKFNYVRSIFFAYFTTLQFFLFLFIIWYSMIIILCEKNCWNSNITSTHIIRYSNDIILYFFPKLTSRSLCTITIYIISLHCTLSIETALQKFNTERWLTIIIWMLRRSHIYIL